MAAQAVHQDAPPSTCTTCGNQWKHATKCDVCDYRASLPPVSTPVGPYLPEPCPDTSVHTNETYVLTHTGVLPSYDPELERSYHSFRHSGWRGTRDRTRQAILACFGRSNRVERFDTCGRHAHVFRHVTDSERFQVRSEKCRDRWCVPCARERARALAATLADFVAERTVRFITLTLKSSTEPLLELVDKILASFRKLRRAPIWKGTQVGGAAFLEVKWNPQSNRWHPHLHIISEGRYIPQQRLRDAWYQITGDSFIVDVRPCNSRPNLCSYITKYVASPVTHSVTNNHDLLCEAMRALHGRRTCTTYGTWRGLKLIHVPEKDDWTYYGSWEALHEAAVRNPWGKERKVLAAILAAKPPSPWKTTAECVAEPRPPP